MYWHADLRGGFSPLTSTRGLNNLKHSSKGIFNIQAVYIACDRDDELILISMPHTFMLCFIVSHIY